MFFKVTEEAMLTCSGYNMMRLTSNADQYSTSSGTSDQIGYRHGQGRDVSLLQGVTPDEPWQEIEAANDRRCQLPMGKTNADMYICLAISKYFEDDIIGKV